MPGTTKHFNEGVGDHFIDHRVKKNQRERNQAETDKILTST